CCPGRNRYRCQARGKVDSSGTSGDASDSAHDIKAERWVGRRLSHYQNHYLDTRGQGVSDDSGPALCASALREAEMVSPVKLTTGEGRGCCDCELLACTRHGKVVVDIRRIPSVETVCSDSRHH